MKNDFIYFQFIQLPPLQREEEGIRSLERRDLKSWYYPFLFENDDSWFEEQGALADLRGFDALHKDKKLVIYLEPPHKAFSEADWKMSLYSKDGSENITTIFKSERCAACGLGKGNPNYKNPKSKFYNCNDAYIILHNPDYTIIELFVFIGQKDNLGTIYNAFLDGEYSDLVNHARMHSEECYNAKAEKLGGVPLADNWLHFYEEMPHPYLFS